MRAMGANSPYARFWSQLIRWLAGAEAAARREGALVLLRAERTYTRAGDAPITLQALVRKADGTPASDANVSVICQPVAALNEQNLKTNSTPIALQAADSPGVFEGKIAPEDAGDFLLQLIATDEKGAALGTDELPLHALPASAERDQTARNDVLLHAIADRSRGQFIELTALPELVDSLLARQHQQADPLPGDTVQPLYNFPAMFVAFVLLLTVEWILRRRWQLR
jgi:hypothetical protein